MKKIIFRAFALAAVMGMSVSAVSCGSKDPSSSKEENSENAVVSEIGDDVNISAEDMPYGATLLTMTKEDYGVHATTEVDHRFFTEDEGKLISDFFCAIGEKDAAMFESVSYEPLLKDLIGQGDFADTQEYINEYHSRYEQLLGEDFDFNYIYAVDCKDANSGFDFSIYDDAIKEVAPNAEISEKKAVPVYLNYKGKTSNITGEVIERENADFPMGCELYDTDFIWICLYNIDGSAYVVS